MKKVFIKNSANQKLAGLLFGSDPSKNLIVVCHGFKGSKEGRGKAIAMAERFSHHFDVLLFDFRGCGESEGKFEDITLSGQIDDLNSVINWAIEQGYKKIGCVGRSFGGTTVICSAATNNWISSVVCWSAPGDLKSVFSRKKFSKVENYYIVDAESKELKIKESFFEDIEKFDVYKAISSIAPRPVFIIHADRDDVVLVETAYKLFDFAGRPKRLKIIKEDDHIYSKNYKLVWELTLNWFKETL